MSVSKIQKFIDKPIVCNEVITRQPLLVTSSKGFSIKRNCDLISELGYYLDIKAEAGGQFASLYPWIVKNLPYKVQQFETLVLYVWLGTCDLTFKEGKYIKLRHTTDQQAQQYLVYQINKWIQFVRKFSTVKLIFLEIPPYSITQWNSYKGHANPQIFHQDDKVLLRRICYLNEYLTEVNFQSGVQSPKFILDTLLYRKKQGETRRSHVNYKLFKDGVHPSQLLARCWTKKLIAAVLKDCV